MCFWNWFVFCFKWLKLLSGSNWFKIFNHRGALFALNWPNNKLSEHVIAPAVRGPWNRFPGSVVSSVQIVDEDLSELVLYHQLFVCINADRKFVQVFTIRVDILVHILQSAFSIDQFNLELISSKDKSDLLKNLFKILGSYCYLLKLHFE